MKTKKLATLSLAIALAMILSFVESQIPTFIAVPGVKIGLANIAIVFVLYKFGWKEAAFVSLIRVFLVTLLFGNLNVFFYSMAGAVLSLIGMIVLMKTDKFSTTAISVAGGVLHNIGQIGMASILLETAVIKYYLPALLISGTIAGIVIGIIAVIMIDRIKI